MDTHHSTNTSIAPIGFAIEYAKFALPEFTRLPRAGERCRISNLSRSTLNGLILGPQPLVKSVCLRKRGAQRGVRLIVTSSLLAYLHAQIDENNEEGLK